MWKRKGSTRKQGVEETVKRSGKRCNSSSGGDNKYLLKAELNQFVGVRDKVESGMTPGS